MMNQKVQEDKGPSDGIRSGRNKDGSWWKLLQKSNEKLIFHHGPFSTRMIGNSNGVEEEWQRKLLKAEVELPHRRREFELEDERHPKSGGLSWMRLTCAGVRVGDSANTEGMNEGGREPEVQQKSRKKAKVKVRKRKKMNKFRNPNAGSCEVEPTSFRDSPKGDHRG
ncbi:hypothetical protein K438DRAFT_1788848 [Mycena galopus ATCC 62051]|nr:hypothetical protein K438DRAFT_1788848 [Mycena galopus ATCC 62051]